MTTWLNPRREQQLRDQLRDLPELSALASSAVGGERLAGEGGARRPPDSRPPLNVAAAGLTGLRDLPLDPGTWPVRDGGLVWVDGRGRVHADDELPGSVLSVLAAWTRMAESELVDQHRATASWSYAPPSPLVEPLEVFVVDRRGATHRGRIGGATVSSECAWLLRHIVWLLDQQWVDELADDVRRLTAECDRVLRRRPEYQPSCPREGCTGTLRDEGQGLWRCDLCEHTAGDRARLGLREVVANQRPMTMAELVRAFRLSAKTLESWVARGHLEPVDPDVVPRRYHPMDALRLAEERGASTA